MMLHLKTAKWLCPVFLGWSLAWTCATDGTLREYLQRKFWMPFAKYPSGMAKEGVQRTGAPYAGMMGADDVTPLGRLRRSYQGIAHPASVVDDSIQITVAAARSDRGLAAQQREEVDLIDAKIDLRAGSLENPERLAMAKKKLQAFLATARTPEYLSEARGWLARVHYLLREYTAAGKIYLDELNRQGSNLSQETVLNSLRMTYGYDGGDELRNHLEEYFDTPEHAVFAIQLVTNPQMSHFSRASAERADPVQRTPKPYTRVTELLEKHSSLLRSGKGAQRSLASLALLGMRAALGGGDPAASLRIAEKTPPNSSVRRLPDFLWMQASARFLTGDYAGAEGPLLALFRSPLAKNSQKAAAAYGLCGVYRKTRNPVERLRFALWLRAGSRDHTTGHPTRIEDMTIYWASSGFDLGLLLEAEVPIEALRAFLVKYPRMDSQHVRYALAVRLSREEEYEEAARIYEDLAVMRRAKRMRQLAALSRESKRTGLSQEELLEAKYKVAEYLSANPERIYFNDRLWGQFQRYALYAEEEWRLSKVEREMQVSLERKLKDDQEERWRAYLILRDVVKESGRTDLGRRSAQLAVQCLRRISDRFGRLEEIRRGIVEHLQWLREGK